MARVSKLPDLEGRWRILRRIAPGCTRFSGVADITPQGELLKYTECGKLYCAHATHDVFRDYLYTVRHENLTIRHPDGRLFLDLVFENGEAKGTHVCGQDTYRALFRIKGKDRILVSYDVSGPRKAYRIVSLLRRQVT